MNYKSKLLSVFLSAGILLNSTSMAFAGQVDVLTDFHEAGESGLGSVPCTEIKGEILSGTEPSAEQGNDKKEDDITWTFDGTTLNIEGNGQDGQKMRNFDYPHVRKRHTADVSYPDWEKYVDPLKIKKIVIKNIKRIGNSAFNSYWNVTSLELPEGLESIGNFAFNGTRKLTKVEIPSTVKDIENGAFQGNEEGGLTSLKLSEGLESIGNFAFAYNGNLETVEIPSTVHSIGMIAFKNCGLRYLKLPKGQLKNIEMGVFYGNEDLQYVEIPSNVESIGRRAFEDCSLVYLKLAEGLRSIGKYAFYDNYKRIYEETADPFSPFCIFESYFPKEQTLKIPSTVESIGEGAFEDYGLTSLELSEGLKSIGDRAFCCNRLKTVKIPNSIEKIGMEAFNSLPYLTSITLPKRFESQIDAILWGSKDNEGLKIEYTG